MEIDMIGNPELFDIENKKLFGLWPHDQLISKGINPYIRRIRQDKLAMLVVGDLKGESINDFLTENDNIIKMNVVNVYEGIENAEDLKELYSKNISDFKGKIDKGISKDKLRDIVCIEKTSCTQNNLELYYNNVKPGGIFCGNEHESPEVKAALLAFRRNKKIGTPISVANRTIWFWYKRI